MIGMAYARASGAIGGHTAEYGGFHLRKEEAAATAVAVRKTLRRYIRDTGLSQHAARWAYAAMSRTSARLHYAVPAHRRRDPAIRAEFRSSPATELDM